MRRIFLPEMVKEHLARYNFAAEIIKKYVHVNRPTLADAACGIGYGTDILRKAFPDGKVLGIDIRLSYLKEAQENYGKKDEYILEFIASDVRKIPFPPEFVDALTAFEITEHLPRNDQPAFLTEIFRVLKPNGVAILSVPQQYSFEKTKSGEVRRAGLWTNPFHLHEPDDQEIKKLFNTAGLEVKEQFGQIIVEPEEVKRAKKLNKILPIWPIFAWHLGRKIEVTGVYPL